MHTPSFRWFHESIHAFFIMSVVCADGGPSRSAGSALSAVSSSLGYDAVSPSEIPISPFNDGGFVKAFMVRFRWAKLRTVVVLVQMRILSACSLFLVPGRKCELVPHASAGVCPSTRGAPLSSISGFCSCACSLRRLCSSCSRYLRLASPQKLPIERSSHEITKMGKNKIS